jgi:6-phosphogluconolactonase/glucosamine-6-phosphate isomerase/deaminase
MAVTTTDLRAAARRYAASLPDRFDVVHLGLGGDGHTASWPPGDSGVLTSGRAVELVDEFNGHRRMKLTPRVVNGARSRLVLAVGAAKKPMVERWLLGDGSIPVTAVRRAHTWLFLDAPAAPTAPLYPAR